MWVSPSRARRMLLSVIVGTVALLALACASEEQLRGYILDAAFRRR